MQPETTAKIDIIKTAIDLLCKHVKYDDAKAVSYTHLTVPTTPYV